VTLEQALRPGDQGCGGLAERFTCGRSPPRTRAPTKEPQIGLDMRALRPPDGCAAGSSGCPAGTDTGLEIVTRIPELTPFQSPWVGWLGKKTWKINEMTGERTGLEPATPGDRQGIPHCRNAPIASTSCMLLVSIQT
jgi:hypothetical protein